MVFPTAFRRSTNQRESPGTTLTTQTMWAASTSSARNPQACCTFWMRRASKDSCTHACQRNKNKNFISSDLNFSQPSSFLCTPSFPHATDKTLLAKFKQQHQGNKYFIPTPVMEPAFVIQHFAGKVKYHIKVWWQLLHSNSGTSVSASNGLITCNLIRISGRRIRTTCVQTSWRCCAAATEPSCGSSSAWTRWPCSDGASWEPQSGASPLSMRRVAPGPQKQQVNLLIISYLKGQGSRFCGSVIESLTG